MSDKIKRQIKDKPELFDYPDLPATGPTDEQKAANNRNQPQWMKEMLARG
jgi:hypothetical protein